MKKYFNKLLFLSMISLFILIPTKTKAAADDIVMFMECSYSVTHGESFINSDRLAFHKDSYNYVVNYTEILDENKKTFGIYASTSATEFKELSSALKSETSLSVKNSNDTRNSFVESYASNSKTCPKYMTVEEIGKDNFVVFSNKLSDACSAPVGNKCKMIYESRETNLYAGNKNKKVLVNPKEDSWSIFINSDEKICSSLNVEISISSSKQLFALPLYNKDSAYEKYTNWTKPELISGVNIDNIKSLAVYGTVKNTLFDPYTGNILGTTGFSFLTVGDYKSKIHNDDNWKDTYFDSVCFKNDLVYSTKKNCLVYDDVEENINSYTTAFYTKYNALKAEANKHLEINGGSYKSKLISDDKSANFVVLAAKINQAISDFESIKDSQSERTVSYLEGLIDGGTLCSDTKPEVARVLNDFDSKITDGKQIIIGLKNVLEQIKAKMIEAGDTENAKIVDGYINSATASIDRLNVIARRARESYLENTNFNIVDQIGGASCNIISTDLREFLQTIVDYVRIIGIVLAIILGILDYIKVIFGSDEKSMSKANKNMMTRIIAVALLFLIPAILNFALGLFDVYGSDTGTCGVE